MRVGERGRAGFPRNDGRKKRLARARGGAILKSVPRSSLGLLHQRAPFAEEPRRGDGERTRVVAVGTGGGEGRKGRGGGV